MEETADRRYWSVNLLLTLGVMATVAVALLLSQLDVLQRRPRPSPPPIAEITLTPATAMPAASPTPLPVISLPSPTATASPAPATDTPTPEPDPPATAVAILPQCGHVPAAWAPYTVRWGDTLSYLSLTSGATIDEIIQANCLHRTGLLAGMRIFLPARPPTRIACGPPVNWLRYTIRSGDTMFSLARSRGTTVYAILHANCRDSTYLIAGQQIFLPPAPAAPTIPPTATATMTAIATASPTVPVTATATETITFTSTATVDATASATLTPTATEVTPGTGTPTVTPTADDTPTAAPSATATAGPTNTPEPSPTLEPSPTPIPTNTPMPTATAEP